MKLPVASVTISESRFGLLLLLAVGRHMLLTVDLLPWATTCSTSLFGTKDWLAHSSKLILVFYKMNKSTQTLGHNKGRPCKTPTSNLHLTNKTVQWNLSSYYI